MKKQDMTYFGVKLAEAFDDMQEQGEERIIDMVYDRFPEADFNDTVEIKMEDLLELAIEIYAYTKYQG